MDFEYEYDVYVRDEHIKALESENETLRAQIEAVKKPLTENETLRAQLAAIMEPLSVDEIDTAWNGYTNFANAIHRAILARIDNKES